MRGRQGSWKQTIRAFERQNQITGLMLIQRNDVAVKVWREDRGVREDGEVEKGAGKCQVENWV